MPQLHRLRSWFRRHSLLILWLIVILGGVGGFRRAEDNTSQIRQLTEQNRQLGEQNKALTLTIKAQDDAQQKALCDSRVEARTDLKNLLLGMVDDFIPVGRPARYELERRINEELGPPPEDCT
jgi:hypothetical protein